MNFDVSNRAADDLSAIADFLASESSIRAALRCLERYDETCRPLRQFPRHGHRHASIRDESALTIPMGRWLLIYEITGDAIRVLRIVAGSSDLGALALRPGDDG